MIRTLLFSFVWLTVTMPATARKAPRAGKNAKTPETVQLHQYGITAVPPRGWFPADYDAIRSFAVERRGNEGTTEPPGKDGAINRPPFSFMRYREPYDALNTEVRIVVLDVDTRPRTPVETAKRWCKSVVSRSDGFAQAGPVKWRRIKGFQTGECRTRGVLYAEDRVFEVERREFIVQRDAQTIVVEFSGPPEELVDLDPIVDGFLERLRIAPRAPVKS